MHAWVRKVGLFDVLFSAQLGSVLDTELTHQTRVANQPNSGRIISCEINIYFTCLKSSLNWKSTLLSNSTSSATQRNTSCKTDVEG